MKECDESDGKDARAELYVKIILAEVFGAEGKDKDQYADERCDEIDSGMEKQKIIAGLDIHADAYDEYRGDEEEQFFHFLTSL